MADELTYIIGSDGETKVFDEYHLRLHDYHEEDRACGRAFLAGGRVCDVSAYGWFGVELNHLVDEYEDWMNRAYTREDALATPWMLVLDNEQEGHAWQDGHEYTYTSTYDESERDFIFDFVRIS